MVIDKSLQEKITRAESYLQANEYNEGLAILENCSNDIPEVASLRQSLELAKRKKIDTLLAEIESTANQKNWQKAFDLAARVQQLDSEDSKVRSAVERLRSAFASERHEQEFNKKKHRAQALLKRSGKSIHDIETAIRLLEEVVSGEPGELDAASMLDDANRLRSDFLRSKGIIATLEQAEQFEEALEKIHDLIQRGFSQYEGENIFDYRSQLEKKARIFADQKAANLLKKAEDELDNDPKLALHYIDKGLALPALPKTREDAFNELKLKVKHAIEKYEKVEKLVQQADQLISKQDFQQAISILENALAKIPNFPDAKNYLDQARQGLKDKVLQEARITIARVEAGISNETIGKSREKILAVMDTLQLDGEEAGVLSTRCREILEKIKQLEQSEKELQKTVERASEALEKNDFSAAESEIQSLPKELQKRPEIRTLRSRMTRKQDTENALDKVKQLYEDDQLEAAREQIKILKNRDRQHREVNQLYNEIEGTYQYNRGVEAYNEGNLKNAGRAFKKIVKIGGDQNDEAHEYLQKIQEMSEQDRQAKQSLKTAQKHTEAKRYKEAYQILTEVEGIPSSVKQKVMELRAAVKEKWRKELIRKITACLKTNGLEEMLELAEGLKEIRRPEDNKLLNNVSKSHYIQLAERAASQHNWCDAYQHWQEAQKYDAADQMIKKGLLTAKKQNFLYEAEAAQNEKEVIRILESIVERQPTNLSPLDSQIDERLYHAYLITEEFSKALTMAGMRMRLNAQFAAQARSIKEFCLRMKKSKEKFQRGAFSESLEILNQCQGNFPEYADIIQEISERRTDDIINKLLAEAQAMERKGENEVYILAKYREILDFEPNHRLAKKKSEFLSTRFNRNVKETIKEAVRCKEDENISAEEIDYLINRIHEMMTIATEDQKARLTPHLDNLTDKLHNVRFIDDKIIRIEAQLTEAKETGDFSSVEQEFRDIVDIASFRNRAFNKMVKRIQIAKERRIKCADLAKEIENAFKELDFARIEILVDDLKQLDQDDEFSIQRNRLKFEDTYSHQKITFDQLKEWARKCRQNLDTLKGWFKTNRMNAEALEEEEWKLREDTEYDFNYTRLAQGLRKLAGKYRSGAERLITHPEPPRSQPAQQILKEAEERVKQWGEKARELETEAQEIQANEEKVKELVQEAGKMINDGNYAQAKTCVEQGLALSPTNKLLRHYNEVIHNAFQ
ncbi:MAG: hypothetical protein PVH61_13220 [Candidatus Aminicenantes bacterium]|jgi:hypothetical protein